MTHTRFSLRLGRPTALALFVLFPLAAQAQLSGAAGVDLVSSYFFRGVVVADGPTLQPALAVQAADGRLSVQLWGSLAVQDRTRHQAADELDLIVGYAQEVGQVAEVGVGVTLYTFPNQASFSLREHATPELYVSVAPRLALQPQLTVFYDVHLGDGAYTQLSGGHTVGLAGQAVEVGVSAGFNHGQFGAAAGWSALDATVATTVALGRLNLTPRLTYVRSFANTGTPGHHVLGGLHLHW